MTHAQVANAQPFPSFHSMLGNKFLPYKYYVERSQSTIVSRYPQLCGSPVQLVSRRKIEKNPIASSLTKGMAMEEGPVESMLILKSTLREEHPPVKHPTWKEQGQENSLP